MITENKNQSVFSTAKPRQYTLPRSLKLRLPLRQFSNQSFLGKRLFDIVFSSSVCILFSPLFCFIWLGVRLSSPGKAIYAQERLGQHGNVFKCFKFRTMSSNAEQSLETLLERFPYLKKEWQQKQKLSNDPRVFRFGKFLRKTSLDELPQFWNVLKGDLSVVGPRPYMVNQLKEIGPYAEQILSTRPGITGIWQTSGRSSTTFRKRIILDAEYVHKQSFWLDCFLILKTLPVVLFSKNAC